ncbi:MAG: hypothetical protein M1835_003901 [Candelina submexicana]|nr:MAG: hypothetical protein M1835_003901 [Candelina submexicana]
MRAPSHLSSQQNRKFWWKRHRIWSFYHDSDFQKLIERRQRTMKHRCTEALQRSLLWDRGQLNKPNLSRWGWRPSSSWGGSERRWANGVRESNGRGKDGEKNSMKIDMKMDGKDMLRRFEALKQEFEQDPYTALFGTRMQRNIFSPEWFKYVKYAQDDTLPYKTPPRPHNAETCTGADSLSMTGKDSATIENTAEAPPIAKGKPSWPGHEASPRYECVVPGPYSTDNHYEIDPITLRKVWPKKTPEQHPQSQDQVDNTSVDIPVKTFADTGRRHRDVEAPNVSAPVNPDLKDVVNHRNTESRASIAEHRHEASSGQNFSPDTAKPDGSSNKPHTEPANRAPQGWLVQEGFGPCHDHQRANTETSKQSSDKASPFRKSHKASLAQVGNEHEPRQVLFDVEESKAEDLDLLRSSDVRAASGIIRKPRQDTALEGQRRREQLERDFQNGASIDLGNLSEDAMVKRGMDRRRQIVNDTQADNSDLKKEGSSVYNNINQSEGTTEMYQIENRVQHQEILHAASLQAQETAKEGFTRISRRNELDQRPGKSQAADLTGEGDMSANVSDFATRARWYKNKVPHADRSVNSTSPQFDITGKQIEKPPEKTKTTLLAKSEDRAPIEGGVTGSTDGAALSGLKEYEEKIGPSAYNFEMGSDTLEADLVKQSQDRSHHDDAQIGASPKAHRALEHSLMDLNRDQRISPQLTGQPISPHKSMFTRHSKKSSERIYPPQFISTRLRESQMRLSWIRKELDKIMAGRSSRLSNKQPVPAAIYKILAFDSNTGKMTTADTTSSHGRKEEALSPSSVLLRMNRPTEFFPYITSMQADGYEIVSGRDDMLVFQKMHEGSTPLPSKSSSTEAGSAASKAQPSFTSTKDLDQRKTSDTSTRDPSTNPTVISPPLSHQSPPKPTATSTAIPSALDKVTREEAVFSGSSRKWQDEANDDSHNNRASKKGKVRKAAQRVFWVGVWTAGCAYAVGVVAEYFRTGGANGLGPQGF